MNYQQALDILELDAQVDDRMLRVQYRWFVWFYHPDNPRTGDAQELRNAVQAYQIICEQRKNEQR